MFVLYHRTLSGDGVEALFGKKFSFMRKAPYCATLQYRRAQEPLLVHQTTFGMCGTEVGVTATRYRPAGCSATHSAHVCEPSFATSARLSLEQRPFRANIYLTKRAISATI